MRINCPTCELAFEVSDKQAGQKALCPDCETRFIIPLDPDGEFEVLSVGKAGEAEKASQGSQSAKDGDAKDGDAKDGDAKDGDAKDGDAKDGDAKDGDAKDNNGSEDPSGGDVAVTSVWGLLALGLAVGLILGFLIGWLVWRSPEPNRAPFGDKAKSGSSSPFLQNDVN